MGNRANIKFIEEDGGEMFFYTHWYGLSYIKAAIKTALAKRERWDDEPYLARIIFCAVMKDDIDGTTGFGLSTKITDNNNPIVVVSPKEQTVTINEKTWTFDEFVVA